MSSTEPVPQHRADTAPTKAYVALGLAFLAVFLTALLSEWTDTDPLSARDFVVALAAGIGSGGITGIATYSVENKER